MTNSLIDDPSSQFVQREQVSVMSRTAWLADLLAREIEDRINEDVRTTATTFLGIPKDRIFRDVIGGGQADFNADVAHLTGDDRALLYARYNQRRHLDELIHAFKGLLGEEETVARPTIIDVGCGPFYSGACIRRGIWSV